MARLHRRVTRAIFCLFVLRTLRTHSFPELKKSESVLFGYLKLQVICTRASKCLGRRQFHSANWTWMFSVNKNLQRPSYIPPNMSSEILSSRVDLRTPVTVTTLSAGVHPRFVRIVRHFKKMGGRKFMGRSADGAQTNLSHCQLTAFTKVLFRFLQRDHNVNFINAGCLLWKATVNLESVRSSRRCSAVRLLTAYLILTIDDRKPVVQIRRISNLNKEEKCCRE